MTLDLLQVNKKINSRSRSLSILSLLYNFIRSQLIFCPLLTPHFIQIKSMGIYMVPSYAFSPVTWNDPCSKPSLENFWFSLHCNIYCIGAASCTPAELINFNPFATIFHLDLIFTWTISCLHGCNLTCRVPLADCLFLPCIPFPCHISSFLDSS